MDIGLHRVNKIEVTDTLYIKKDEKENYFCKKIKITTVDDQCLELSLFTEGSKIMEIPKAEYHEYKIKE
jgi:hypothetical protein